MTGPGREPAPDDLLDATPEARAMARARAERAARAARLGTEPPPRPAGRRKALIGGLLLLLAGARVLERAVRTRAN